MRRFIAIARTTALEILAEPLSLLVLTASLALAVFAPAFHYHQFGEPSRMARDAGLSALFVGGMLFAIVGAARSVRREFESGTAAVALSHPVSRVQFLVAKACGAYAAFALFALAIGSVTAVIVNGAEIGAAVARKSGDIPRLWGVSYACGVASIVLPYIVGAVLNRFFRFRFSLSAFVTTLAIALASLCYRPDASLLRLLPAIALLFLPAAFFVMASTAAAAHLKINATSAVCAVLNRFFRFRFSLSAFVTTLVIALASLCYRPDASLLRLLPAIALLFLPAAFFVMASTAAAAHLKINATSAVCAVLAACFLPFAGNYCLSAALSGGGTIPWVYVAVAAVAALPATIAAAIVGTAFTPSQL